MTDERWLSDRRRLPVDELQVYINDEAFLVDIVIGLPNIVLNSLFGEVARRAKRAHFGYSVNPSHQKYFSLSEAQITCMVRPVLHPQEGLIAIVTDVGCGMRWTLWPREASAARADGEVVWS